MNIIKVFGKWFLFCLFNNRQAGFVDEFQPDMSWSRPRTVFLIKYRHRGASHVLLDEDESVVRQTGLASPEEHDQVVISEVTEDPLAPDGVVSSSLRHELVQAAADVAVDLARLWAEIASRFLEKRWVGVDHVDLLKDAQ